MSYTVLEEQSDDAGILPQCHAGIAHYFTEEIPEEEKIATNPGSARVQ